MVGFEGADIDCVSDERRLDKVIDIGLHGHGRAGVDLEQPRLHLLVQHDVEAQQLKAALQVGHQRA